MASSVLLWYPLLQADPLDSWTQQQSQTANNLTAIAYGATQFVAVGQAGTILPSPDGVKWTQQNSRTSNDLYSIAYGKNQFVAVGINFWGPSVILSSPDGINWTPRNPSSGSPSGPNSLVGVVYGNNEFVAVGVGILTSPDGVTWTSRGQPYDAVLNAVSYGCDQFVAAGYQGVILTSPDGVVWNGRSAATNVDLWGIALGNHQFVAVGLAGPPGALPKGSTFLTSTDGVAWTSRTAGEGNFLAGITYGNNPYGNNQFVAVGNCILSSPDGITWTKHVSGTSIALNGVAFGKQTFVAVGNEGTILQSGLLIPAPPVLGPMVLLPGGGARVQLSGQPGQTYTIQVATDLNNWYLGTGNWVTITNFVLTNTVAEFVDDLGGSVEQRFYRAISP
jgi:hypothetical protein